MKFTGLKWLIIIFLFFQITVSDSGSPGIYILELVPGKVAHSNGQLQVGDRILEIAHVDLWNGSPEQAARVIQVLIQDLNQPSLFIIRLHGSLCDCLLMAS